MGDIRYESVPTLTLVRLQRTGTVSETELGGRDDFRHGWWVDEIYATGLKRKFYPLRQMKAVRKCSVYRMERVEYI